MIDFIIDTIFWFVVFWLVIKMWEAYLIAKNEVLTEQIKEISEQIKNTVIHVDIEKHDDVFYLYNKDTQEFIAQGSSFAEVKEHCETRFKGKAVIANEAQMDQLGFK
jgi:hypothetical protein